MDAPAEQADFMALPFSFRGRIGRGKYWIGVLLSVVIFFVGVGFFASVMNPTGSGSSAVLAIPVLLVFLWVYSAVTVKRLRDAGWPLWALIVYPLVVPLWIVGMMEFIEVAGLIYGIVAVLLLAVPGIIEPAEPDAAPSAA